MKIVYGGLLFLPDRQAAPPLTLQKIKPTPDSNRGWKMEYLDTKHKGSTTILKIWLARNLVFLIWDLENLRQKKFKKN